MLEVRFKNHKSKREAYFLVKWYCIKLIFPLSNYLLIFAKLKMPERNQHMHTLFLNFSTHMPSLLKSRERSVQKISVYVHRQIANNSCTIHHILTRFMSPIEEAQETN